MDNEPAGRSAPATSGQPERRSTLGRWALYLGGVGVLTAGVILAAVLLGASAGWTGLAALAVLVSGVLRGWWRRGKAASGG